MGRRAAAETVVETDLTSDEQNGDVSAEPRAPLTSAQRLSASSAASAEVSPDPFGPEAKYFTEVRCLNRDVSELRLYVDLCACNLYWWSKFKVDGVGTHRS